ncbi:MAG: hypothetical protein GKC04_09735, partial [Methanomicrobiales archaeon]|nr:hypothetical protein [Methanomicrobiales archaeon]
MEFVIEDQRIFALEDSIGAEQARVKAEELKGQAFGALSKLMILSRKDDTLLRYMEKRYEPFWHLQYRTHLEYERQRKYAVDVKPAVRSVVLDGREYRPDGGRLHLDGCEFCVEDLATEAFVDAVSGKRVALDRHVTLPRREIAETEELGDGDVIVVPAKVKASSLTRSIVAEMLHPVEADSITVEEIRVQALHL